jgi:UDP-glucose 4-epimerase
VNRNTKKRCLILGGGGFIGSHLAEKLLHLGYSVRIFDVKNFSRHNIRAFENELEISEGDFHNPIDVSLALEGANFVYHLISTTIPSNSVLNPTYDIESNLIPTVQLLQICTKKEIEKVIFVSSGGTIYGVPQYVPIKEDHPSNPINSYGITKRTIESYFILYNKLFNLNSCIFRLSNPYGEKQNPHIAQGAITIFSYKSIVDLPIEIWGDGEVIRDYIYIEDVVQALISSLTVYTPEIIYNLGSGVGTSLNDIIKIIKSDFNKDLKVTYGQSRNFDVPANVLDISLIENRFNWRPKTDLTKGLHLIYNNLMQVLDK